VTNLTDATSKDIMSVPFYQPSHSIPEHVLADLAEKIFERYKRIGIKNPTCTLEGKQGKTALDLFRALAQEMDAVETGNFLKKFSEEIHAICMSRPNLDCDEDINPIMLSEFFHIVANKK